MFDSKQNEKFLSELAAKLTTTAHQLTESAKRMQMAELTYREYLVRLRRLEEYMRTLIDLLQKPPAPGAAPDIEPLETEAPETNPEFLQPPPPPTPRKLRYADYIEFTNYSELKKFENLGQISDDDVQHFDADEALRHLMNDDLPTPPNPTIPPKPPEQK